MTSPTRLLKYAGSKSRIMPALLPYLTGYDGLNDAMCGSGCVTYTALRAGVVQRAHMGDANPWVHGMHQVMRSQSGSVRLWLASLLDSRDITGEYYYEIRDELNASGPCQLPGMAARLIWLNRNGFNGLMRLNKKGEINVPWCKRDTWPLAEALKAIEEVASVADRITMLDEPCGFDAPTGVGGPGWVKYYDPPYLGTHSAHTAKGFTIEDHRRLASDAFAEMEQGTDVVISHSDTPEAREIYGAIPGILVSVLDPATYRSVSRGKRGTVSEIVFHSRPLA
jgi:DNA adenine methylase